MKNLFPIIIAGIISGLFLTGCEDVPVFQQDETVPVVEAFLYEGKPVEDIYISEIIPFESDAENTELNNLQIQLTWNDQTFTLVNSTDGGGRYVYPGTDLEVRSGDSYELSFMFEGKNVYSTTTIPQSPGNVEISARSLDLLQLIDFFDLRDLILNQNNSVIIEWDNPNSDYFFIVVENIENNPESIDLNNILNFNFEYVSTPTQDNFFTLIPFIHYTQFGTHRIIVYRVNEEYALLYETINQDSRDLNEPYTNITNGVGVFSGIASDTLFFEINKVSN